MKGLRLILNIPPTHEDRTWTNKKAIDLIESLTGNKFQRFPEAWKIQKLKLLGHIIRCDKKGPLHQVTFQGDTLNPRALRRRRVGKPRERWLAESLNDAFIYLKKEQLIPLKKTSTSTSQNIST